MSVVALLVAIAQTAQAVTVSPSEMAEARRWTAAIFEGAATSATVQPGLEVVANFDRVQTNARFGKPLKLAGATTNTACSVMPTARSLCGYLRQERRLKRSSASIATNRRAAAEAPWSSAVQMDGKEAFRSAMLKEGMPPLPVKVDLGRCEGVRA